MKLFEALVGQREKVETITFYNGKEFSMHEFLMDVLDAKAYFIHLYQSWERSFNKNTNPLVRQYLPKGSSFDHLAMKDVNRVENLVNTRAQKYFVYQTLHDIYNLSPLITLAA